MMVSLPPSFLWGAALSSYQTEGENYNCDWWIWEKQKKLTPAGKACQHYQLFEEDFKLARQLNLNSLRISLEWSRIFSDSQNIIQEELAHYVRVVEVLNQLKIKPVVTLHHFTNPLWFVKSGGWGKTKNIDFFLKFLNVTVKALKENVDYWVILNEPLVYIYNSFIRGIWPPGEKSLIDAKKVLNNLICAYVIGYQEIKKIYCGLPVNVSLAKHIRVFYPCPEFPYVLNKLAASFRNKIFNISLIDYLANKHCLDFIGVNYYCKEYVKFKGLVGDECGHDYHNGVKNNLDWYIDTEGFYSALLNLKRFNLPVVITENGTSDNSNTAYEGYLKEHLKSIGLAMQSGVNVQGYFWWSLLDNFEWDKGFHPRFGLVEVNYENYARKIKPFALTYAKICKDNMITIGQREK